MRFLMISIILFSSTFSSPAFASKTTELSLSCFQFMSHELRFTQPLIVSTPGEVFEVLTNFFNINKNSSEFSQQNLYFGEGKVLNRTEENGKAEINKDFSSKGSFNLFFFEEKTNDPNFKDYTFDFFSGSTLNFIGDSDPTEFISTSSSLNGLPAKKSKQTDTQSILNDLRQKNNQALNYKFWIGLSEDKKTLEIYRTLNDSNSTHYEHRYRYIFTLNDEGQLDSVSITAFRSIFNRRMIYEQNLDLKNLSLNSMSR